jgi:hypothetical protein
MSSLVGKFALIRAVAGDKSSAKVRAKVTWVEPGPLTNDTKVRLKAEGKTYERRFSDVYPD